MTVHELADEIYKMVAEATQMRKKLKPGDLTKAMIQMYGDQGVDKKMGKDAIKELVDSGRCIYTYFGGSYLELPHQEGAANE